MKLGYTINNSEGRITEFESVDNFQVLSVNWSIRAASQIFLPLRNTTTIHISHLNEHCR